MASRFWVGSTGTWDASDTTHWSASSGGAGGASVPNGVLDLARFDANSGAGTVTVNHATLSVGQILCGAFTGTLDFSVHNNDVSTGAANLAGTCNLGNGTWTITGNGSIWIATGATINANGSTIVIANANIPSKTFTGGVNTYNKVRISDGPGATVFSAGPTIATLELAISTVPAWIQFQSASGAGGLFVTVTNPFSFNGSPTVPILITGTIPGSAAKLSVPSGAVAFSYAGIRDLNCTGGATFTAANSFDYSNNAGITITPPAASGGLLRHPGISGGLNA